MNRDESNSPARQRAAIVLCGGQSRRMGVPKAGLPWKGTHLLGTVAERLEPVCHTLIAVGSLEERLAADLQRCWSGRLVLALDEHTGCGPLEGIRIGLQAAREFADAAFVTPCDTPELHPDLVAALFDKLGDADAVIPCRAGRVYGLTAIYHTRLLPELNRRVAAGQLRVADLADLPNACRVDPEWLRTFDPHLESLTNLNRPGDYLELLKKTGQTCPPELLAQWNVEP